MDESSHEGAPDRDPRCPFCSESVRAAAVDVGRLVYAIEDAAPVTPGHILVVPKRHTRDFFTMSSEELRDTEAMLRSLRERILLHDPTVTGFNVGVNCGASAGQTLMHAHIHLIPRRDGDTDERRGGVRGVVPARTEY